MSSLENLPPRQLTFVTIAQNEASNIERCLRSTIGLNAVHLVVDGGSTDDTDKRARLLGAQVLERPFRYSADQYNFGLDQTTTPWAFILDADEALDADLYQHLTNFCFTSTSLNAFHCRRRNRFIDRWVNHGAWYPDYNIRLLRVGSARYEDRHVHARVETQGEVGTLSGHILHYTYISVSHYIRKLNSYTDLEVRARTGNRQSTPSMERKAIVRKVWLRTPFKPLSRFIIDYVFRKGFLDGRVGLDIAVSAAYYEYVVEMKRRYPELRNGPDSNAPRTSPPRHHQENHDPGQTF